MEELLVEFLEEILLEFLMIFLEKFLWNFPAVIIGAIPAENLIGLDNLVEESFKKLSNNGWMNK